MPNPKNRIFRDMQAVHEEFGDILISASSQSSQFMKTLGDNFIVIDNQLTVDENTGEAVVMVTYYEKDYKFYPTNYLYLI